MLRLIWLVDILLLYLMTWIVSTMSESNRSNDHYVHNHRQQAQNFHPHSYSHSQPHRLRDLYLNYPNDYNHPRFDHWLEYADVYESHLQQAMINNKQRLPVVKMLEIGLQNGGSMVVWNKYFSHNHQRLVYVGIDIEPKCKQLESLLLNNTRVTVEIGSQSNLTFMQSVCLHHGPFDLIVDDGGHVTEMMMISFTALWPYCMKDKGVYVIEDTHAMTIFGEERQAYHGKDIFGHMADLMRKRSEYLKFNNHNYQFEVAVPDPIAKHVSSMVMTDSMIVLHYQSHWQPLTHIVRGKEASVITMEKNNNKGKDSKT